MKIDVIIGNPPYQEKTGGGRNGGIPLYAEFVKLIGIMQPKYSSLIIPTRWYIDNSRKLSQEVRDILLTPKTHKIFDIPNSKDVFLGVNIQGGVMYFVRGFTDAEKCEVYTYPNDKSFEAVLNTERFIRDKIAYKVYNQMIDRGEKSFKTVALKMNPYGLLRSDVGDLVKIKPDDIEVISSSGIGYIRKGSISKNANTIDNYKVIVGYNVDTPSVVIKPKILKPNQICTLTYCVLGCLNNVEDAVLYKNFLKLKFVRYLIRATSVNQSITHENLVLVPFVDIREYKTDEQLYDRYNITQEERKHIESTIKAI